MSSENNNTAKAEKTDFDLGTLTPRESTKEQVISASNYRKQFTEIVYLQLPSEYTFGLRKLKPDIANRLIFEMSALDAARSEEDASASAESQMKITGELAEKYLPLICADPKVSLKEYADTIMVDEIAFFDKMAILMWASGTAELANQQSVQEIVYESKFPEDRSSAGSGPSSEVLEHTPE